MDQHINRQTFRETYKPTFISFRKDVRLSMDASKMIERRNIRRSTFKLRLCGKTASSSRVIAFMTRNQYLSVGLLTAVTKLNS